MKKFLSILCIAIIAGLAGLVKYYLRHNDSAPANNSYTSNRVASQIMRDYAKNLELERKRVAANAKQYAYNDSIELQQVLAEGNKEMPIEIVEGVILIKVIDDGRCIIFLHNIDDSLYSIDAIREQEHTFKKDLFDNADFKEDIKLASEFNRGLIYRYKGTTAGGKVDIKFSPQEVRALARHIKRSSTFQKKPINT